MGNSCFKTKTKRHEVSHCRYAPPQNPGGSNDTHRSSGKKLVAYPLPLPPQHSSTCAQNLPSLSPRNGNMTFSSHLKVFTFYELSIATRYFCPDALLGEGDFGYTYKGWLKKETLLPAAPGESKMAVVIKALNPIGFQGDKEWLSEVNYLGQLDHPNLVKLIGFCCEGENKLLVYEFMPQGSLESHLFGRALREQPLSWEQRIKVAVEAARGLSFLHASASNVIYSDFKSSNILLDMDYNVKLSDFGFAKADPMDDESHETTQVMVTEGYTAPEYIATGRLTTKCVVYSFGILLLELITGRRAIDNKRCREERNLLDWVTPQLIEPKKIYRIMDVKLEGRYSRKEAFIVASIARDCCLPEAMHRPPMSDVLSILEKLLLSVKQSTNKKCQVQTSESEINEDGPHWFQGVVSEDIYDDAYSSKMVC